MALPFDAYIALGDSISIDVYPAHDVELRYPGQASTDRLGAVSLLYRNDDRFWPQFKGRDLQSLRPSLRFHPDQDDLTADGATTHSLLRQVERIERNDESTLVTITAGGNDLLGEIGGGASDPVPGILDRLHTSIARLFELRPNASVLLGTVYDPSDGRNRLPGIPHALDREAQWLRSYNDQVRHLVTTDPRLRLADIHHHFLGHGMTVPDAERWYLQESIVEPSALGASEVRRLWLDVLGV
jgi:lysophospholipase L1-like esterase